MAEFSIKLSYVGSLAFVSISSNIDISNINWKFENIKELEKKTHNSRKTIMIKYNKKAVLNLNLNTESGQVTYKGPNIAIYLKTSNSDFGKLIQTQSKSNAMQLAFIAVSVIAGTSLIILDQD